MTDSWAFWAALSAGFAAATAVLAKAASSDLDPDFATLIRTGVVLVCLVLLVTFLGKWQAPETLSGRAILFLILSGLATGASWLCYFRALKLGDVSKVAPVDKLSVVLVAAFAVLFLGERPSAREWAGVALVAAGVLVLAVKR
ncbi:MAG: EamA family transporter [Gemmataceae bacterium]|nr:EamA family transporter [Gemmataceae bacterium]